MRQFRLALGVLFAVLFCASAFAQGYPARPIRLVVPFGAGGGTDNLARIIEPLVTKALGQPLVIENRPGGGSSIGMDQVAKSAPDGYTLVMTDTSIAVNPSLKPLPYDTINDFAPVSLLATAPVILVAHPSVPAKTLQEFVAFAKAKPGELNYADRGLDASWRRALEVRRRHRREACALQGDGTCHERPDRWARAGDVLRHLVGAAFHGCRHPAGARRHRRHAQCRGAGCADLRGGWAAERHRLDLLGYPCAEGHAAGDCHSPKRGIRESRARPGGGQADRRSRLSPDRWRSVGLCGEYQVRDRQVGAGDQGCQHQGRVACRASPATWR